MGIWVGRYAIVGGEVQEHGPRLVERQRLRDDESVRLLVLAEPVDARSDEFCHEVADAVAELFSRESASLTGGLLRALRQAHANLAEWNRRSLREHQVAVGLTCVAIRDGAATIAQVGPGVAYVSGPSGLERLSTEGEPAALPIGGPEPVDPQFRLLPLAEHALLLLSGDVERALTALTPTAVGQTLAAGPQRALPELFVRTRGLRDVTAVLIAELPDLAEGDDALSATVDLAPGREPPPEPVGAEHVDSGASDADGASSARARSMRSFPALRRPRIVGRRSRGTAVRLPWRAIGLIGVVVIAIAAAGRFALPPLLEQNRDARLGEAVATAELHLVAFAGAPDAAGRRAELEAALTEISRAHSLDEVDARVVDLEARAAIALAALDAAVEVEELRRVIEFQGVLTAPLGPAALLSGGGLLWLLDGERGRVFAIDPAGGSAPLEVYRGGESYGGAAARDPLAIAWDGAARRLLLLDAGRTLFAIAPPRASAEGGAEVDVPRIVTLRDAAEIRSVAAIASYAGNLYLLDPEGGEVWRYLPAGDGYDSERSPRLGGLEIEDARALIVDVELFLLDGGGLRRFPGSGEPELMLRGIDQPPESPAAVAEDVARGLFYVADRGGRRVVASTRGGEFVAQFRHEQFFDLRGLALSADGSELYVLTGDGIFSFDPLR